MLGNLIVEVEKLEEEGGRRQVEEQVGGRRTDEERGDEGETREGKEAKR